MLKAGDGEGEGVRVLKKCGLGKAGEGRWTPLGDFGMRWSGRM